MDNQQQSASSSIFDKWHEVKQGRIIILEDRYATKEEREKFNVYAVKQCDNEDAYNDEGEINQDFNGPVCYTWVVKNGWVDRVIEFITDFTIPALENDGTINLGTDKVSTPWDVNNKDLTIQEWVDQLMNAGNGEEPKLPQFSVLFSEVEIYENPWPVGFTVNDVIALGGRSSDLIMTLKNGDMVGYTEGRIHALQRNSRDSTSTNPAKMAWNITLGKKYNSYKIQLSEVPEGVSSS